MKERKKDRKNNYIFRRILSKLYKKDNFGCEIYIFP